MKTARFFFLIALVVAASSAQAQDDIAASRRNAIVRAIEKASPAVVSINVLVQHRPDPFGGYWEFFHRPTNRYRKVDSIGSGFIFDKRGYILTNYHVIEEADYVSSVTLPDGRDLEAQFVGADKRADLAILKVEGERLPFVELGDSGDLIIGEWLVAIGNPFGGLIDDPVPSVSVGVVSANHRRLSRNVGRGERLYQDMIQTDAAINPGNSGGPLVNASGKVVGVNTMIFSKGGGNEGLGFAVPISRAKRVAQEIIANGRRRDPWPGFRVQDLDTLPRVMLRGQPVQVEGGSMVVNILRNAPAFEAGLRPGDIIVRVNGDDITTAIDIDYAFWELFVGDRVTLDVIRESQPMQVSFLVQELGRP